MHSGCKRNQVHVQFFFFFFFFFFLGGGGCFFRGPDTATGNMSIAVVGLRQELIRITTFVVGNL